MLPIFKYLPFLATLILLQSCRNDSAEEQGTPVARVGDTYMYSSSLEGLVPLGSSKKDSADIVLTFIQNWIKQQLVIQHAEKNLPASEKDFIKELEDYRNSLVVYKFESRLLAEKLDTNITETEIENYYQQNPGNFELKDNIVKILYVKLPAKSQVLPKIRMLLSSGSARDKAQLASLCTKEAANFFLDDESWLLFSDLLKEIPIQTYDQEAYLMNHRFIEFNDDQFTYLLNFKDYKIKESLSPLSFEKSNIRSILINKRKLKMIDDLQKSLFQDAVKHKGFEIF